MYCATSDAQVRFASVIPGPLQIMPSLASPPHLLNPPFFKNDLFYIRSDRRPLIFYKFPISRPFEKKWVYAHFPFWKIYHFLTVQFYNPSTQNSCNEFCTYLWVNAFLQNIVIWGFKHEISQTSHVGTTKINQPTKL